MPLASTPVISVCLRFRLGCAAPVAPAGAGAGAGASSPVVAELDLASGRVLQWVSLPGFNTSASLPANLPFFPTGLGQSKQEGSLASLTLVPSVQQGRAGGGAGQLLYVANNYDAKLYVYTLPTPPASSSAPSAAASPAGGGSSSAGPDRPLAAAAALQMAYQPVEGVGAFHGISYFGGKLFVSYSTPALLAVIDVDPSTGLPAHKASASVSSPAAAAAAASSSSAELEPALHYGFDLQDTTGIQGGVFQGRPVVYAASPSANTILRYNYSRVDGLSSCVGFELVDRPLLQIL
mmetsp:Transcript_26689/g.52597  ORF Transcript_26689/g.52597 Transcript_26689/m.52597 type:complete len:293 (+) Transcript_26689:247-1125(+)